MIELVDLHKAYKTGDNEQKALDGVSLNFRDSEFVAILGPSGSGKTTLLNIIGGLDHADSGDILIDGTSTKDYSSKDWDTYRNHRIGFVFQSYYLIPHQSVLSNVELALTLSGVGKEERRRRATEALEAVGLGNQTDRKPNQLSGGQMQRVAIARALVNDPEIVLADEPTGALDTDTGLQVMDILKEISNDRLVVMVTHNPELADRYATRIVRLVDGRIVDDDDPYMPGEEDEGSAAPGMAAAGPVPSGEDEESAAPGRAAAGHRTDREHGKRRASMSFLTALGLSFNNLMTKKGRTFLTAFAGSIGIIGIAAILAISTGTNNYIDSVEEAAMTSYPLTVTKSSFDMSSLLAPEENYYNAEDVGVPQSGDIEGELIPEDMIMSDVFAKVKNNDLVSFKSFLESDESGIQPYVNDITYDYGITPKVYKSNPEENGVVQLNPSSIEKLFSNGMTSSTLGTNMPISQLDVFQEMVDNREMLEEHMDVVAGRWPESYDEAVLVLSPSGKISDYTLYCIGVYDTETMDNMVQSVINDEDIVVPEVEQTFTYGDALNLTFSVVPSCNLYSYNADQGTWTDQSGDDEYMQAQIDNGVQLKVVGVVKPSDDDDAAILSEGIAYTPELTEYLMGAASESDIVKQQLANPDVDVFTGKTFLELQDEQAAGFDMSSLFSIDENALNNAFHLDTSALDSANVNIDLSGIDTSSLASGLDVSDVDTSAISSVINADSIAAIITNAPQPDFSDILSEVSPAQLQAIQAAENALVSGYTSYAMAHAADYTNPDGSFDFSTAYADYLGTEEGQERYAALQAAAGDLYSDAIQSAVDDYMNNTLAPYLSSQLQSLLTQAAQVMVTEMSEQLATQLQAATGQLGSQLSSTISNQLNSQMSTLSESLANGFSVDADVFASAIQINMSQEDLANLMTKYLNADELSYSNNLSTLGYADPADPDSISIYPADFDSKEQVLRIIDGYNQRMTDAGRDDEVIEYSDIAGALISSVSHILNAVSMVLIAFVSISLVVSSIMIAIITYISALERRKEIGILRAMGASKGNIANVFNAETIIEGLIAGVFAILVVYIASPPVSAYVYAGWGVPNIMSLPWQAALILVGISVGLTLVAGLIPSSIAAHRDPVESLRSE